MKKRKLLSAVRNNKGFTMVEMLIVLALVALVVSILFGVLGKSYEDASIKQAATKVADDMRSFAEASTKYTINHAAHANDAATLVTAGELTSLPFPPSQLGGSYTWDSTTYLGWKTDTIADTVVKIAIPTDSVLVCQKINELFAGAAEGAAVPEPVSYSKGLQCFGAGPYTALMPVYSN